ncbi:hypothetical protein Salat_2729400 [Sesamum alatum]|uniref:Uncharacterized protein n=1 Tax=Sesamum alatum TaxID=300844 RepID=A0AAE1XK37_9LAMI|nr:hypothetical protein Salat_2729400 [Sesamum alatum]
MGASVKQETIDQAEILPDKNNSREIISLSSSSSELSGSSFFDSDDGESDVEFNPKKKQRVEAVLPVGFLDPIQPAERVGSQRRTGASMNGSVPNNVVVRVKEERIEKGAMF